MWQAVVIKAFQNEREPYLIGFTSLSVNNLDDRLSESIEDKLIEIGYQPNYFSYGDMGQVTSMRRLLSQIENNPISKYYNQRIWKQYHIRVFDDHEVRGHYEIAYEEDAEDHVKGIESCPVPDEELMKIINVLDVT